MDDEHEEEGNLLVELRGLCDQPAFLLNQVEMAFIAHQYLLLLRQGAPSGVCRDKWSQYMLPSLIFPKTEEIPDFYWDLKL